MKKIIVSGVEIEALTINDAATITPEIAQKLMDQHNENYRKVSYNEVKRLSSAMSEGRWHFNGDSMVITKGGLVKDGQHRNLSAIRANYSFPTIIVEAPDGRDTNMDLKKKLSFNRILSGMGYRNENALAATITV